MIFAARTCFLRAVAAVVLVIVASAPLLAAKERGSKEPLSILRPPKGAQTRFLFYKPTQYLHIKDFNIHVFGTKTVSPWMMRESCELIGQMIASLRNPEARKKFSGHQAFLITNADPDLSQVGSIKGHRNTGGKGFSVFNEVLVCAKAVDTIRPNDPPVYRAWDTPVHEFGHAIELTLGLESKSDRLFRKHVGKYDPKLAREYFAWATQKWFRSDRLGSRGRKEMPKWKYDYLSTIFSEDNDWCPGQDPRP